MAILSKLAKTVALGARKSATASVSHTPGHVTGHFATNSKTGVKSWVRDYVRTVKGPTALKKRMGYNSLTEKRPSVAKAARAQAAAEKGGDTRSVSAAYAAHGKAIAKASTGTRTAALKLANSRRAKMLNNAVKKLPSR